MTASARLSGEPSSTARVRQQIRECQLRRLLPPPPWRQVLSASRDDDMCALSGRAAGLSFGLFPLAPPITRKILRLNFRVGRHALKLGFFERPVLNPKTLRNEGVQHNYGIAQSSLIVRHGAPAAEDVWLPLLSRAFAPAIT